MLLWGEHAPAEIEAARAARQSLPQGAGEVRLRDFRVGPAQAGSPAAVEWLAFEAELCFPFPLQDPHAVDWRAELVRARRDERAVACPDPDDVSLARTSFADLDGDGRDEVALTGLSCLSGTGAADLFALFRIDECGRIEEAPLGEIPGAALPSGAELRGHLGLSLEEGRLVRELPLYAEDDPSCCPSLGRRRIRQALVSGRLAAAEVEDLLPRAAR